MIDISAKPDALRITKAKGRIQLKDSTLAAIKTSSIPKGDVLQISRAAAVLAAKKLPELIPYSHSIQLTSVDVEFHLDRSWIDVEVQVKSLSKTGAELEALLATMVALLTIWDMVKPLEKSPTGDYPHTQIQFVRIESKLKHALDR